MEQVGISANGVALHGSMLRSTAWMLGLVVYTGRETKLAQKGGKRTNKMSRLERITNRCIYLIFAAQCAMSFVSAACVVVWDAANYITVARHFKDLLARSRDPTIATTPKQDLYAAFGFQQVILGSRRVADPGPDYFEVDFASRSEVEEKLRI